MVGSATPAESPGLHDILKEMRRRWLWGALAGLACLSLAFAQRGAGRGVFSLDGEYFAPTEDATESTEFYFARLAYRSDYTARWGPGAWMIDSPKAERHFLQGLRRLTFIHGRSMEEYVRPTDANLFDYPWLYVVEPGQWSLSDEDAAALREYMLRGGFIVTDDFHGTFEWTVFLRGLRKIFPEREAVDIPDRDAVFHTLYDIDDKFQVPGVQFLYTGSKYEQDGVEARWKGVYDDSGRLMMVINFNMDLGDAWEHADMPQYPEGWTALAYRLGISYIIYAMTH